METSDQGALLPRGREAKQILPVSILWVFWGGFVKNITLPSLHPLPGREGGEPSSEMMSKPRSKNSLDLIFLMRASVDVYDLRDRFNCLLENGWSCVEKQDEITAVSSPYLGVALPNLVCMLISRSSPLLHEGEGRGPLSDSGRSE